MRAEASERSAVGSTGRVQGGREGKGVFEAVAAFIQRARGLSAGSERGSARAQSGRNERQSCRHSSSAKAHLTLTTASATTSFWVIR